MAALESGIVGGCFAKPEKRQAWQRQMQQGQYQQQNRRDRPRFQNGQYRLSTARWPQHYAYMQDGFRGYVSTYSGDAGPQGWWQLINHPTQRGYYLLSTSKWPECFVFMESGLMGWCRGWNKCDPGPQGYMKFVPHLDEQGRE